MRAKVPHHCPKASHDRLLIESRGLCSKHLSVYEWPACSKQTDMLVDCHLHPSDHPHLSPFFFSVPTENTEPVYRYMNQRPQRPLYVIYPENTQHKQRWPMKEVNCPISRTETENSILNIMFLQLKQTFIENGLLALVWDPITATTFSNEVNKKRLGRHDVIILTVIKIYRWCTHSNNLS